MPLEIFSPGDYASTFGNGIARSLGDLFITSFFLLSVAVYGFYITVKDSSYASLLSSRESKRLSITKIAGALVLYFAAAFSFGTLFQNIVNDSNLQFFDKGSVIPGPSLFTMNLALLFIAFSMFLFLSLAMIKRHAELTVMRSEGRGAAAGRGYVVDDLAMIATLGGASGYLSVLVLALYINSEASQKLYAQPVLLWLLCPLLLYWISRAWMITHRGAMHDDPIVFAFRDRTSLLIGALGLAVVLVAI